MTRRVAAEAIVWILTAFFTIQMFAGPVGELFDRLIVNTETFPP